MGFLEAFLVWMTFVTAVLSLPLSTTDSTQVSCFASEAYARTDDLYTAVYDFCANTFPNTPITSETCVDKTFNLTSGSTALVKADLDPAVSEWTSGDCIYTMGTVVSQCAADGASTGGVYNPVGSGASEFTVKVNCTSDSAKCASESASVTFNSSNANVNKRDSIQCFVKAAMPDRPSVPTTFAIDAVENFCKDQDGKFYNEGDQYIILYTWYVPNQELSILAHRSATIWEADCQRAFDPVLRQCSSSDWQSFTGGLNDQVPIQYSLDVRNPVDASSSVEAGGNVAARSPENADTGNFNASDSTFSKFSTTCDSLPSSGGLTIPSRNTFSAIDQFCAFVDGKPLAKGQQDYLSFEPALFANAVALSTVILRSADCHWAYDTLSKACTWDDLFYGGMITFDGVIEYVLEVPPAGFNPPTIAARDVAPFNSTNSIESKVEDSKGALESRAENECWNIIDHTTKVLYADWAVIMLCGQTDGIDMEVGDWQSWTTSSINPPVKAKIHANLASGMDYGFCTETFHHLVEDCSVQNIFFGGVHTYMGVIWSIEILDKVDPSAVEGNKVEIGKAEGSKIEEGKTENDDVNASLMTARSLPNANCDDNGASVSRVQAYTTAADFCLEASKVDWTSGTGVTHLYQDVSPWISARIVFDGPVSFAVWECISTYTALIESCVSDSRFRGGYLELQGAKWSLQVVSGREATSGHAVSPRSAGLLDTTESASDNPKCKPVDSAWVTGTQARNALTQFCHSVGGQALEARFETVQVYQEGHLWVSIHIKTRITVTIDPELCTGLFNSLEGKCNVNDRTSGGEQMWDDAVWTMFHVTDQRPQRVANVHRSVDLSGSIESAASTSFDICDHGAPVDSNWASSAASTACSKLVGSTLPAGLIYGYVFAYDDTYQLNARVQAFKEMVMDEALCKNVFNFILRSCTTGSDFYGTPGISAHDMFWSLTVQHKDGSSKQTTQPGLSNVEAGRAVTVTSRQANNCLRAEASPIDKQVARQAIGQFCPDSQGFFLTASESVHNTVDVDGIKIGLNVQVTADEWLSFDARRCIGSFEMLLSDCSDGVADSLTNGGTYIGDSATYSLTRVYF